MIKRIVNRIKSDGVGYVLKRGLSIYFPKTLIKHPKLIFPPLALMVEPASYCNLRCPLCSNKDMKRPKGVMDLDKFKSFIDNLNFKLREIVFSFSGEPLVNQNIFKMIKYASVRGVKCQLPTNGLLLHKFDIDEILNSGLTNMIIAFDGATKETYSEYRKGGDFDQLVKNVKKICEEKRKRNLKYPIVTLQALVMKHNQHELDKIKGLAKELKPDYLNFKSAALWTSLTGEERDELAETWMTNQWDYARYDPNLNIKGNPGVCPFMFDKSVILWNGDMSLCCLDFEGKYSFGNAFEVPFMKIYRSRKFQTVRKLIYSNKLGICKECDLTNAENSGKYIKYENL